jgi:hypothetical protein|nr:cytochrome b/b6 domain-containing protein [Shewanella sp. Actino-trap-3]
MPLNNLHTINVWDVLIRIFHWSLVGFFTLAYLTEGEDEWMTIHSYAGYSILILIVFRLLWGCIKKTRIAIAPMAPSITIDRLTDSAKIEKWFTRNFSRYATANIRGKLRHSLYIITFKPIDSEPAALYIFNHRPI